MARTFVDRGGTFTDVVVLSESGRASIAKVRSDRAVVGELAQGPLVFGTTVATNALLEGHRVPTLLLLSEGLGELPWLRDMSRPGLFDPDQEWPEPLCLRVVEVSGRLDTQGVEVEPLRLPELDLEGIESVAIVLVNAHASGAHEEALAATLPERLHVSLGHRCAPELGYLARIHTTLVDAAITPLLREAMRRDAIPPDARAMRSDGSLCPASELRAPEAVLSGPAGGVLAVAEVARRAGFARAVGLDMGGTSTDVCRVDAGSLPRREGLVQVAGVQLARSMLEVETIAAGGGSVLQAGARLQVGPASAGATPGPACYGAGGPPTLTDAALLCGLVQPQAFQPPLDPEAARAAVVGDPRAYLEVAREKMAQAVHKLATARGVELRDHALVAYGGAAGQHAAKVAERLGISTVVFHPCAAVLSAWGQALARREESAVRALWTADLSVLPQVWSELSAELPDLGEVQTSAELRHEGTDHLLEVFGADPAELLEAFEAEHIRRYGYRGEGPVELVNARVRVRARAPEPPYVHASWGLDGRVQGPRVLFLPTTAIELPEGWQARQQDELLLLERTEPPIHSEALERSPKGLALWGNRFMSVAEQSGEVLRRLARSVNIRERLDFSCALFDGQGQLVANAPHIPVHLGAMGETVRDLLSVVPEPEEGQAWLTNDPAAGGSHLPDLTVISCVRAGDQRWFVASRGHHADVGGLTPGSMPPHSTRLDEEGFLVRRLPLIRDGRFELPELPSRLPQTLRADLRAQVAANAHAARLLEELGTPREISTWMGHLQDSAAEGAAQLFSGLDGGRARDELDGLRLQVELRAGPRGLVVDFGGTEGPHPGNLNAPPAVVRAAVLYVLRVLAGSQLPLNEGALRHVELRLPRGSILDPEPGRAVVGGNVETSQRVVDLLFRAAGARAASQGTMNNLTLGGGQGSSRWSFYETIGGGVGASPAGPGRWGRQVHMTNTRATDVEVLEARLPLRVRRFQRRPGSGGEGTCAGGDGLVRELELLAPATASLLASNRAAGAQGLGAGGRGQPGVDELYVDGAWRAWDGSPTELSAGDRVRVSTPGGGAFS